MNLIKLVFLVLPVWAATTVFFHEGKISSQNLLKLRLVPNDSIWAVDQANDLLHVFSKWTATRKTEISSAIKRQSFL